MKLPPCCLVVIAALLAAGCSKTPSDNVASNTDANKSPVVSPSTDAQSSTAPSSTATSGPDATGTTGAPTSATTSGTSTSAPSATAKPSDPTSKPPVKTPDAPPSATTPPTSAPAGAPPVSPNGQPQMTDEQKKQMEAYRSKQEAAMKENSAKAAKATRKTIPNLKGKYTLDIDAAVASQLASIDAAVQQDPSKANQAEQIKSQIKSNIEALRSDPPTFTFDTGGNVVAHTPKNKDIKGFTSMIDGKPCIVIMNPDPKAGEPAKLFVDFTVQDGGKTVVLNRGIYKRS